MTEEAPPAEEEAAVEEPEEEKENFPYPAEYAFNADAAAGDEEANTEGDPLTPYPFLYFRFDSNMSLRSVLQSGHVPPSLMS